jgi:hypothetical protein
MASLIVLTKPLSPILDVPVTLVILKIYFMAEAFGVPDHHVIINLCALSIEKGKT